MGKSRSKKKGKKSARVNKPSEPSKTHLDPDSNHPISSGEFLSNPEQLENLSLEDMDAPSAPGSKDINLYSYVRNRLKLQSSAKSSAVSSTSESEESREERIQRKMADVQAASRRLQNRLEIYDPSIWPSPSIPFPTRQAVSLVQMNGVRLRAALDSCSSFGVDQDRRSAEFEFLDKNILTLYKAKIEKETDTKSDEMEIAEDTEEKARHVEETPDSVMTGVEIDIYLDEDLQHDQDTSEYNKDISKENQSFLDSKDNIPDEDDCAPKAYLTEKEAVAISKRVSSPVYAGFSPAPTIAQRLKENKERNNPDSKGKMKDMGGSEYQPWVVRNTGFAGDRIESPYKNIHNGEGPSQVKKDWPTIAVPDPFQMPSTFTNAICYQPEFSSASLLTLTLIDTTPSMHAPSIIPCTLLLHFEVGLDGVDAICQGQFKIVETTYWKKNVREERLGKVGTMKSSSGEHSKELEANQIKKGFGQGWWIYFGVRFKHNEKENEPAKGGNWVCFGVPIEACSQTSLTEETATFGGSKREGIELPKYEGKVNRMNSLFSIGGIACMDLWEGAEQWEGGVWAKVKNAMANNSLKVSFLYPVEEIATA